MNDKLVKPLFCGHKQKLSLAGRRGESRFLPRRDKGNDSCINDKIARLVDTFIRKNASLRLRTVPIVPQKHTEGGFLPAAVKARGHPKCGE